VARVERFLHDGEGFGSQLVRDLLGMIDRESVDHGAEARKLEPVVDRLPGHTEGGGHVGLADAER
jgi:hypothetical protein